MAFDPIYQWKQITKENSNFSENWSTPTRNLAKLFALQFSLSRNIPLQKWEFAHS